MESSSGAKLMKGESPLKFELHGSKRISKLTIMKASKKAFNHQSKSNEADRFCKLSNAI